MADQRTALIFGAGKIGRGFVAEVLSRADCQLYFVDSDQERVDRLNRAAATPSTRQGAPSTKR